MDTGAVYDSTNLYGANKGEGLVYPNPYTMDPLSIIKRVSNFS